LYAYSNPTFYIDIYGYAVVAPQGSVYRDTDIFGPSPVRDSGNNYIDYANAAGDTVLNFGKFIVNSASAILASPTIAWAKVTDQSFEAADAELTAVSASAGPLAPYAASALRVSNIGAKIGYASRVIRQKAAKLTREAKDGLKEVGAELLDKTLIKANVVPEHGTPELKKLNKKINKQSANVAKKLEIGAVDEYGVAKKQTGDGTIHRDHQPSKAALIARAEELKGDALTPAERKRIIDRGLSVNVPGNVHSAGPTYGGKNTPKLISSDKSDLTTAANRDADAMVENARRLAPEHTQALERAADTIKKRTNVEYDEFLLKQLDDD
jgi:hypothetical protein